MRPLRLSGGGRNPIYESLLGRSTTKRGQLLPLVRAAALSGRPRRFLRAVSSLLARAWLGRPRTSCQLGCGIHARMDLLLCGIRTAIEPGLAVSREKGDPSNNGALASKSGTDAAHGRRGPSSSVWETIRIRGVVMSEELEIGQHQTHCNRGAWGKF